MWLFKEFTSVIIELVHAFCSAHIEVWHTGSLMSTQEARIALSRLSSNSCASLKPSKLLTFIYASTKHIRFELIPQFLSSWLSKFPKNQLPLLIWIVNSISDYTNRHLLLWLHFNSAWPLPNPICVLLLWKDWITLWSINMNMFFTGCLTVSITSVQGFICDSSFNKDRGLEKKWSS